MSDPSRTALIVGASRGLGLGVVQRLLERGWDVTATQRRPSAALEALPRDRLRIETVDIDRDDAVTALRHRLDGMRFGLVFVVAGVAPNPGTPIPEVPRQEAGAVFQTNAISPIRFAEAFHGHVAPGGTLALMTSILGSVANNTGGGWESYRASKAALNTLGRCFHGRHRDAGFGVVLMHPGWVRTDMGGAGADLDVATSTRGMVEVLEARAGARDCVFLDYRGDTVPW